MKAQILIFLSPLIIKHNLEVNTLRNGYLVVNFCGKAVGFKSGSLATFHGSHSLSKKGINSRLNEEEELKQQGHLEVKLKFAFKPNIMPFIILVSAIDTTILTKRGICRLA